MPYVPRRMSSSGSHGRRTRDPETPTSRGYICPKGAASAELLYHPDRVLQPLRRTGKRGENKWEPISWDEALDEMAERLLKIKRENGPQYFGMMHGTGRPYENLGARFAKAFGTPNFTGVAHICFWPRVYANIFTQAALGGSVRCSSVVYRTLSAKPSSTAFQALNQLSASIMCEILALDKPVFCS